jgi:hypothetical protein
MKFPKAPLTSSSLGHNDLIKTFPVPAHSQYIFRTTLIFKLSLYSKRSQFTAIASNSFRFQLWQKKSTERIPFRGWIISSRVSFTSSESDTEANSSPAFEINFKPRRQALYTYRNLQVKQSRYRPGVAKRVPGI